MNARQRAREEQASDIAICVGCFVGAFRRHGRLCVVVHDFRFVRDSTLASHLAKYASKSQSKQIRYRRTHVCVRL